MRKILMLCIASAGLCLKLVAEDSIPSSRTNMDYIDPTIGNVGQLLEPTRPTTSLPNEPVRVYPIRKDYLDDRITCWPLTAVSHRLGEVFSIKPALGSLSADTWDERMPYDHNLEITRPWYYSAKLIRDGIRVEFAPGKKTGFYRFTFPATGEPSLLFGVFNDGPAEWRLRAGRELEAMETWHGDIKIFVYGVFSIPGKAAILSGGQLKEGSETSGTDLRTAIRFASGTHTVGFKYAISFISQEQAKKNFKEEIKDKDFETVKNNAQTVWGGVMSQIRIEGGTDAQRRSFYTALYRCYERMVDISEDGRYYSGYNKQVNTDKRPFYVDDWSWDTYLAMHPLRMILHPKQEEDMLQSYVRMYQQSKWMPTFPVLFGDYACMNGFHSSIIFLDAYRKGLRNFDVSTAYDGMKKNALDATLLPWRNGDKTSLDDFYQSHGYFPALHPGEKETVPEVHPFEKRQAVAVTLGASFDDWATLQLGKELGRNADTAVFAKRADNYKNLWNKEQQFFLPKDEKGDWINIDPAFDGGPGGRDYYDENNGWTYLWQVQQNIPSLISMMGGKKAFEERLDQLFRADLGRSKQEFWNKFPDATSLIGEFSMANEPCFHIPYLYNFTDAPWKTQQKVRLLLSTWFRDDIFGIPGDEDGGGMSAFVVFSSMGFYPVTPGIPLYTIGSPVFSKVTIGLAAGKKFTILAHHSSVINKYIQHAKLNGKTLTTPWFTHQQLIDGGTLELEMGPQPDKTWGTAAAPMSKGVN